MNGPTKKKVRFGHLWKTTEETYSDFRDKNISKNFINFLNVNTGLPVKKLCISWIANVLKHLRTLFYLCCYMILWISIKEQKTELCLFVTFEHFKFKILQAHAHGRTLGDRIAG